MLKPFKHCSLFHHYVLELNYRAVSVASDKALQRQYTMHCSVVCITSQPNLKMTLNSILMNFFMKLNLCDLSMILYRLLVQGKRIPFEERWYHFSELVTSISFFFFLFLCVMCHLSPFIIWNYFVIPCLVGIIKGLHIGKASIRKCYHFWETMNLMKTYCFYCHASPYIILKEFTYVSINWSCWD